MSDINNFFSQDEEIEWMNTLPTYQKETINELLKLHPLEEAAVSWLEASIGNTSPFSGEQIQPKVKYFTLLKREIHKLLCGNPQYESERNELVQLIRKPDNRTAIVSWVSALIGAKVGLAATFVAPAVVIVFMLIAKTSINAWCSIEENNT